MIYQSPYPAFNVPTTLSISQFLLRSNPDDVSHDRIIVSDFDRPSHGLGYGEARTRAAQAAASLRDKHGVTEGDVVATFGQNSVNHLLVWHAVFWAGGCISAINPQATSYELVHYLGISKPKVVAVDAALLPTLTEALHASSLAQTPQIIVIEDFTLHSGDVHEPKFPKDFVRFQTRSLPPLDLRSRDNREVPAAMCFSSGTSEGVVLSHHNLIACLLTVRATSPHLHGSETREVFFPSFAHIYGLVSAVLLPVYVGCSIVVMKRFEFMAYLRKCVEIKATILRLVPALAARMIKDRESKELDLRSVKNIMVSGAALSPNVSTICFDGNRGRGREIVQDLRQMLSPDAAVLNGFGMTEATIMMLRETQSHRAGSLGRPVAGASVRIVDDDLNDVQPGRVGECLVKGPTVFMHWCDNPGETSAAFTKDGWLRTGDMLHIDEDGYFWMTGRKKELIKFKGNQVAPAEIEALLLAHPAVTEAGVCGMHDAAQDTELPTGCIVLASGVKSEDISGIIRDVSSFVNVRLAKYKSLRGGLFTVDALPKGPTGKLLRRELPAIVTEKIKLQSKL
ncbi:acyl-CoA synthetases/AMP-acid ligases II [Xylariaceae sp. FL1019]|nr:acyl-CoA synthetases/AMP-acid ligases II [Xylariaceae sp. FL1019]